MRRPAQVGDFLIEVSAAFIPGYEVCWEVCTRADRNTWIGGWVATEDAAVAEAIKHGGRLRVARHGATYEPLVSS